MNNLADSSREKAEERILKSIKIKCKKCQAPMIKVYDIWDESYVGWSCTKCPHYLLVNP